MGERRYGISLGVFKYSGENPYLQAFQAICIILLFI